MSAFTITTPSMLGARCRILSRTDRCALVGRRSIPSTSSCCRGAHHRNRSPSPASVGAAVPMGRCYSSPPSSKESGQTDERQWKLLYHRDPSRAKTPRALLGVSTFNMCYWTWYCADFTPAINASAHEKATLGQIDPETLEMLLVEPTMGYLGLGISCVIWLGSYLYSKQLVSAIWGSKPTSDGDESLLAVSTLKLPFVTQPEVLKRTVYDPENNVFDGVENIVFTDSDLRSVPNLEVFAPGELALSEEQKKNDLIVRFDGEFSRLRGHIVLKKEDMGDESSGPLASMRQHKYILDINSNEEVMHNASPALLHSLVIRDYPLAGGKKGGRHDSWRNDNIGASTVVKERKTRRPNAEKRRHVTQLEIARNRRQKGFSKKS